MYYANSFLNQLLPNKAKKVRYAPPANASQISEGHFVYLEFPTSFLHFLSTNKGPSEII